MSIEKETATNLLLLSRIFSYLGLQSSTPLADTDQMMLAWKQVRSANENSDKKIAARLKLSGANELRFFDIALARWDEWVKTSSASPSDHRQRRIAELRVRMWIEEIESCNDEIQLGVVPQGSALSQSGEAQMLSRVRALELLMRSALGKTFSSQDELARFFEGILGDKDKLKKLRRNSKKGDLLSGTTFGQLLLAIEKSNLYREELQPIYEGSSYLRYLQQQEQTFIAFLHDVSFVRNQIAHVKPLTQTHMDLLNLHYEELTEPLEEAFRQQRFPISPAHILKEPAVDLDKFRQRLIDEIREGQQEQLKTSRRILGLSGANLAIGTVSLLGIALLGVLLFQLVNPSDPREQLQRQGIEWNETALFSAIKAGDAKTIELFLQGGMKLGDVGLALALQEKFFNPGIGRLLIQYHGYGDKACPEEDYTGFYGRYEEIAQDPERREVMRNLCDPTALLASFDERLKQYEREAQEISRYNQNREQKISECIRSFGALHPGELMNLASDRMPGAGILSGQDDKAGSEFPLGLVVEISAHVRQLASEGRGFSSADAQAVVEKGCANSYQPRSGSSDESVASIRRRIAMFRESKN